MIRVRTNRGRVLELEDADYLNKDEWFGKTWLVSVSSFHFVVEGDYESSVIDEFVDSDKGHLVIVAEEDIEDEETIHRAGNYGEPCDLTCVHVERCTVLEACG